ncbi:C-type mannose receptor 2-like isoform X2 [Silurus meridionalis]|uniref:C-type mannose receptor 2-like isoform X2 n=1 Tax=Silurus meridionalis TaxID=175797 RepID=UPI001EEB4573|nr:C-type mannose receptor 2-like isoform X2 [Silurus meridionalis]
MAKGTTVRAMIHLLLHLGFCTSRFCLSRHYHFIDEYKTWAEAQRYCRENYVDLASVDNAEEELALIKSTDIRSSKQTWIGLYDDRTSWKWSLDDDNNDDDAFYQGDEEKCFRNWFIQKPGKWDENKLCAIFLSFNGAWQENDCSQVLPFVCFDESRTTSEKYVVVNQYMTWTEAQRFCREHYTDLASVRNENENQNIRSLLSNYFSYYNIVWIGLYRTRSWSDKSNSTFSNWKIGQPDNYGQSEYCTAVSFIDSDSGKWTDENCNQTIPFLCYSKSSSASTHVYHFVNKSKTWLDAQSYCRGNNTDLATINNMEEMNTLLKTVNASYSGLAWIGLYDDLDSWRWSLDDDSFYKEGEKLYRGWYQEPNNYNGKELCVFIQSDGTWADGDCNNYMTFVCYNGRNGTNDYIWVNQNMNWAQAQHYCRQYHKDLASVRNQADNNKILNLVLSSQAWIGLYRTRLWSDQHGSTYENWRQATPYILEQPDNGLYDDWKHGIQQCTAVSLEDSGQWTDEDCLATLPFICYNKYCAGSSCKHQYHFVPDSKIWTEAQSYCRENYTDLATINTMADMGKLLDTVYGTYSGLAWIGLYDDLNSWKWSLEDDLFYKEEERSFRNWFQYKQRNWFGNSLCVYFSSLDAIWWGASCYTQMAFICFDARTYAGERHVFVNQYLNWTEAQRYCRDHFTDLISVRNETENQKIRSLLFNYNYAGSVWIGLYSTMFWSDKSDSSFSNWYPGKPDNYGQVKYCTAVYTKSGKWTDEDCVQAFPFVCYISTASISHNYQFVNENKTWTEAQRYCREYYTDLATIDNMDKMNSLFDTVKDSNSALAWIGLYDNQDDWRWSLDDDNFYKEGEKEFRGWYHEPNNNDGKELCVSMYKTGEWFDQPCIKKQGFVCFNGTNNTYVWISEGMTWEEAQRYCRAKHTDLASVRNETELQQILNITQGFEVWIGLYRNRLWSDQSNSTFTFWRPEFQPHIIAEPDNGLYSYGQFGNQHCIAMDSTGKWTDENCFSSFPFFCYSDAVIGLQMKINVRGNLPDSQIKTRVLIQLQQELTRLGMSGKITLKVRNIYKISL